MPDPAARPTRLRASFRGEMVGRVQWVREESGPGKLTALASNTARLSTARGQALLYVAPADGFRSMETVLDLFVAITQVASREGSTVRSR